MACSLLVVLFVLYRQAQGPEKSCFSRCPFPRSLPGSRLSKDPQTSCLPACEMCDLCAPCQPSFPRPCRPAAPPRSVAPPHRQMPHKRSLALGTALFGSSFLGAVRYLFGTWLPSTAQLIRSPVRVGAGTRQQRAAAGPYSMQSAPLLSLLCLPRLLARPAAMSAALPATAACRRLGKHAQSRAHRKRSCD